jgi:uncharacterized cupredoxin-like copper-binding protein
MLMMPTRTRLGLLGVAMAAIGWSSSMAAEPPAGPPAIEVTVEAGNKDNALRFVPDHLSFERGKYYKLLIHNGSPQAHYFTAEALSTRAFTRKVEVISATGQTLAEVHGVIHDLELQPGTTAAWYFYPMTNGEDLVFYCHKEGHRQAGMAGAISISGPPPFQPPAGK